MKIRYFSDTDTALIEFSNVSVVETKEISENLYIDLDEKGNLVSMTIEHAKEKAGMSEVSFLQMEHGSSDLRAVRLNRVSDYLFEDKASQRRKINPFLLLLFLLFFSYSYSPRFYNY